MMRAAHTIIFWFMLALAVQAQLVRQASSVVMPTQLPTSTTFTTANAFPTLAFSSPMQVASIPGQTDRLFVAERAGNLQVVSGLSSTPVKSSYVSLSSLLSGGETLRTDGENGFLSVAFHPNFATNRTLYVYFSIQASSQLHQRLHQITVSSATANSVTITQHKPLLTIRDVYTNHNGGTVGFGADGFLYLSTGDEGDSNDSRNNARFINTQLDPVGTPNRVTRTGFWGQMLRIAVEVDPVGQPGIFPANTESPNSQAQDSTAYPSAIHGNYRVPVSNPFRGFTSWHGIAIAPTSARTEIWATGFRNPFRWSFDAPTGRFFMGDVGQNEREEVNIVTAGGDYGWSWREGTAAFTSGPSPASPPAVGFTPVEPIFDYARSGTVNGNVITGGMVYRTGAFPELVGKYIYSDYGSGQIVALTENGGTWTPTVIGSNAGIVHFGVNPFSGEMLMCDLSPSQIVRLVRGTTTGTAPPATLSGTGIFSSLATLAPSQGVVPYGPNVSFWSDYATKSRWFAIQNLVDTIGFSKDGNWTLPSGMIWVKHFDIETTRGNSATRRKLETRVLVKTTDGVYGLSYRWRADQTNADLVGEEGLTEVIPSSSPSQTWRYPSRTECTVCHTASGGFALSFNTRQLNRTNTYGSQTLNQLTALAQAGYLSSMNAAVNTLPAHSPATDTTASLEARVRSYLAVNCVQCHQPGGSGNGNWDARITTATDSAGLINGLLLNSGGDAANRFAVPNDVAHSMVLKRLQGSGVPRMPPLATSERDLVAEQLLTDWINSLGGRQSFAQWQAAQFTSIGGGNAPGAQPTANPDFDDLDNRAEYLLGRNPLSVETPYIPDTEDLGNTFSITFQHPANRSAQVETSVDMINWSVWDVPGNAMFFPASSQTRTLTGPKDGLMRAFRIRLSEQ